LPVYVPRKQNVIQKISHDHFPNFEEQYDDHYAKEYGKYRIIRIKEAVEKFLECGDYLKGIARIKCTNVHSYIRILNISYRFAPAVFCISPPDQCSLFFLTL